jgi:chromosome segregation ATPase
MDSSFGDGDLRRQLAEREEEVIMLEDRVLTAEAACAYAAQVLEQFESNRNATKKLWSEERGQRESQLSVSRKARDSYSSRRLESTTLELADAKSQLRQIEGRCVGQMEALDEARDALAERDAELAASAARERSLQTRLKDSEARSNRQRDDLTARCASLEASLDRANVSRDALDAACETMRFASRSSALRSGRIAAYTIRRACRTALSHGLSCWVRAARVHTAVARSAHAMCVAAVCLQGPLRRGLQGKNHLFLLSVCSLFALN